MIDDTLTNPPMPDWNDLSNDERSAIVEEGERYGCQCCGSDAGFYVYEEIRRVLRERERRYFQATMAGPPDATALNR